FCFLPPVAPATRETRSLIFRTGPLTRAMGAAGAGSGAGAAGAATAGALAGVALAADALLVVFFVVAMVNPSNRFMAARLSTGGRQCHRIHGFRCGIDRRPMTKGRPCGRPFP